MKYEQTNKKNKFQLIKKHLLSYHKITSWTAIDLYGATRLSDIIYKLRKQDWNIETNRKNFTDRYGNISSYAEYILK